MQRSLRRLFLLLALFIGCSAAAAQEDPETRNEFWPEVDVWVQLNPKFRLFFLATVTRAEETKESFEGQVGVHLDYFLNKHISFRTGYRYGTDLGDNDDPFDEHRLLFEQTFRTPVRGGFMLYDRNREDLRWVNGNFSVRYRNRLTVEREFTIRDRSYTPYVSGEIFYDSRFDTWNRNRLVVGIQWSFRRQGKLAHLLSTRKNVVLDFYFMRQNDSRSQPHHVNGFGLVTNFFF